MSPTDISLESRSGMDPFGSRVMRECYPRFREAEGEIPSACSLSGSPNLQATAQLRTSDPLTFRCRPIHV